MDKIFIEHLALKGKHGVPDAERAKKQEFVLDISIDFDTRMAAASDELKDTIDYSPIRKAAKEVVEHSSFHLLEKLADAVAKKILEDARISNVSVTVRKTEMYKDCTPGITVVRKRS
jgi:dihydroneopterin aldolase